MRTKKAGVAFFRCLSRLRVSFQRKRFSPDAIFILLKEPLGLGDLLMLAPFVDDVASRKHGLDVSLITEHRPFFDIAGVRWVHPEHLDGKSLKNALIISPTLSWRHAKYLQYAGWYLGYFLSDSLISNFSRSNKRYDARKGHYFDRIGPLVEILDGVWSTAAGDLSGLRLRREFYNGAQLPGQYCCIAPYSNWKERTYPLEFWQSVVSVLRSRYPIVLIGGRNADEVRLSEQLAGPDVINLVGKTTILQVADIISRSRLFIGNDSGLAHLAFRAAPASVVVFGCVGGEQRVPLEPKMAANIRALGNGAACPRFPCYDGFTKPECRNHERYVCLSVSPDAVLEEAFSLIEGRG